MTVLNIGAVTSDRPRTLPRLTKEPCPQCRAGSDKRETVGSFGTNDTRTVCGCCGHEFKEQA